MVAMAQRLDARSFYFHTQLIVFAFLALVLKVCRNRLRCHGQSVAELALSNLSNFGHSVNNSSTASKRWLGGKSLSGKRQRTSYAIIRPPQSSVTEG